MLRYVPVSVKERCPPRWWPAGGDGLLALAVLLAALGVTAWAAPAPEPDAPGNDTPLKTKARKADLDAPDRLRGEPRIPAANLRPVALPALVPEAPLIEAMGPAQIRAAERAALLSLRQSPAFEPVNRLGIFVEAAAPTLANQLDLPAGQGLVLEQVQAGSAADKAGLKAHDILLEINGQPVPDEIAAFARVVATFKAQTPFDVMLLRKGRRETIKGLALPESRLRADWSGSLVVGPALPDGVPLGAPVPIIPNLGGPGGSFPANGVMTVTFRSDKRLHHAAIRKVPWLSPSPAR